MPWCLLPLGLGAVQTSGLMVVSHLWVDRRGGSGDLGLPLTAFVLTTSRFNPSSDPTSIQVMQKGWLWYLHKLRQADVSSSMRLLNGNTKYCSGRACLGSTACDAALLMYQGWAPNTLAQHVPVLSVQQQGLAPEMPGALQCPRFSRSLAKN